MTIISERDYLLRNYLNLVNGRFILNYRNFQTNPEDSSFAETSEFMMQELIKKGVFKQKQVDDFVKLTEKEAEDFLINQIKIFHWKKVFLNRCPKCQNLARTPVAKQCPSCFYSWRETS